MNKEKRPHSFNGVALSDREYARLKNYQRKKGIGNALSRRFRSAMAKVIERTPAAESPREKQIFIGSQKIGYLLAMSEMELWWNIHNVKYQGKAAPAKTKKGRERDDQRFEVYRRLTRAINKSEYSELDEKFEETFLQLSSLPHNFGEKAGKDLLAAFFGIGRRRLNQIIQERASPHTDDN